MNENVTSKLQTDITELRKRGIVKLKDEDTYAVWVKTACGNLNSAQIHKLADITELYARGFLLFSSRQIPIIPFVRGKDLDNVQRELASVYLTLDRCGPTVRNVNVCLGKKLCLNAITDPITLAQKLDNFFQVPMAHKVKLGVAGCARDCIISRALSDIGFVPADGGDLEAYDAYIGGRLGLNPFLGIKMAENLDENECLRLVQNFFELMNREGRTGERAADLIERLGADAVKRYLLRDLDRSARVAPVDCPAARLGSNTGRQTVKLRAVAGEVTAAQLKSIAGIALRYGAGLVHFHVRGGPEIPGIGEADVETVRQESAVSGMEFSDGGLENLQSCFGGYCTESLADPQSLLRKIDIMTEETGLADVKMTISASGCPNSCGIAHLSDIGFYGVAEFEVDAESCTGCGLCEPVCKRKAISVDNGVVHIDKEQCRHCGQCLNVCPFDALRETRRGFAVLVGGSGGKDTRLGQLIADCVSEDEAIAITLRLMRLLKEHDTDVADLIDLWGFDTLKNALFPNVVTFSSGIEHRGN
ncbi:Dissimilatory sulfite reductase (desulfoviridin), alpha and beta subunits [Dehalogenimonas alkenigignens]|uniref:Dissimilatory sulfite reductase (Desulfoviridin), alpha and beta subunits n=1 Tax=Dehalogenimonas alkenigignens TaxID=1217799 RepID=A0A0W0GL99_9CHLR|nr:4Fe-4S binding protein [Dehalogenimonas alkenigignens]KTB49304.1 Dissimilatory sulfite reductase (desulfoviridin), alpha and beta subunits [Dehalogenimonas alkenigignens]